MTANTDKDEPYPTSQYKVLLYYLTYRCQWPAGDLSSAECLQGGGCRRPPMDTQCSTSTAPRAHATVPSRDNSTGGSAQHTPIMHLQQ